MKHHIINDDGIYRISIAESKGMTVWMDPSGRLKAGNKFRPFKPIGEYGILSYELDYDREVVEVGRAKALFVLLSPEIHEMYAGELATTYTVMLKCRDDITGCEILLPVSYREYALIKRKRKTHEAC